MKKAFDNKKNRDYFISVAMATYNGEKFIKEQIESILNNLNYNDEIIISDDGSRDKTIEIIKDIKDERIKLIGGPQKGVIKNFENAIKNCNGRYIFLADQDDIWMNNKVEKVLDFFEEEKCECVVHDAIVVNGDMSKIIMPSYFKSRKTREGKISNIIKPSYLGCCMAFSRNMLNYVLPFPEKIEMHDRWIGSVCDTFGKVKFLNECLIKYRRHGNNVSEMHRNSIATIIKNRIILINYLRKLKNTGNYTKDNI